MSAENVSDLFWLGSWLWSKEGYTDIKFWLHAIGEQYGPSSICMYIQNQYMGTYQ